MHLGAWSLAALLGAAVAAANTEIHTFGPVLCANTHHAPGVRSKFLSKSWYVAG